MAKDYSFKKNMIGILLLAIYPMVYGISFSFFKYDMMNSSRDFLGLGNYLKVLKSSKFTNALGNTVVWTVFNVVFQLILATIISLVLNEKLVGRGIMRTAIMVPWAIPSVIAVLIFKFLYDAKVGIVNVLFQSLGIIDGPISWVGNINTAMPALIIESIWKGTPYV